MRYIKGFILIVVSMFALAGCQNSNRVDNRFCGKIDTELDLIMLNYDHAADRDDGHSAAADRTMLQTLFGEKWIAEHVMPVSGAHGTNGKRFVEESDKVMDAAWGNVGGWVAADNARDKALAIITERWAKVLSKGGDIWIKEGGQSDLSAAAVKRIKEILPQIDTTRRVHIVQHSDWNENHTTKEDLQYVKDNTDYIRIPDANPYLRSFENNGDFAKRAVEDPTYGQIWQVAFEYLPPEKKLDFSDSGELMHILNLGKVGLTDFQAQFLE